MLSLAYPGWGIDFGWLVWIGFIPLFFAFLRNISNIKKLPNKKNPNILQNVRMFFIGFKKVFYVGFTAGFVYYLIIFRWIFSLHPLTALGVESEFISLVLVYLVYIISSAGMALTWGIFTAVVAKIFHVRILNSKFQIPNSWSQMLNVKCQMFHILFIPSVFVLTEYVRSWWFGILWYGPGTLIGSHWTIGSPAYTLADNPLALWLSSYFGIYGIVFLILAVNTFIALTILKFQRVPLYKLYRGAPSVISIVIFLTAVIVVISIGSKISSKINFGSESFTPKHINYAIVQTNQSSDLASEENLSVFKNQLQALKQISENYPDTDVILFPEGSNFSKNLNSFQTPAQAQDFYSRLFEKPTIVIDNSRVIDEFGSQLSRVVVTDSIDGALGNYDKRLLTPGGEFLPYHIQLAIRIFTPGSLINFAVNRGFSIGYNPDSTVNIGESYSIAPVVCSGLFSPTLVREASEGADILAFLTSTSIFRGSSTLIGQDLAIARFRAAESAKPLILSANGGLSYAIDSYGNIQKIAENKDEELLTGSIALKTKDSWYNKYGDTPILLFSLLVLSMGMLGFRFKYKTP